MGEAARNQQALYPERTVRSIKRKMGSEEKVRWATRIFCRRDLRADPARARGVGAPRAGRAPAEGRDHRAGLLFGCATERHARGRRAGRAGSGAHSQRAHGGQPGLRLWRRIAAHRAHLRPGRRHLRRLGGDGGRRHHRGAGEPRQQPPGRRRFRRSAGRAPGGGIRKAARRGCPPGTPGGQGAALVGGGRSQEEAELRTVRQDPRGGAGHQALPALASRSGDFARRI